MWSPILKSCAYQYLEVIARYNFGITSHTRIVRKQCHDVASSFLRTIANFDSDCIAPEGILNVSFDRAD